MKGILGTPGIGDLSVREREILRLAAEGLTDSRICRALQIAPGTLGTYWGRIRSKTGHVNRAELAAAWSRHRYEAYLVKTLALVAERCLSYGLVSDPSRLVPVREVFDAVPLPLVVMDDDGIVYLASRSAVKTISPPPQMGHPLDRGMADADRSVLSALMTAAHGSEEPVRFRFTSKAKFPGRTCRGILRRLDTRPRYFLLVVCEAETAGRAVVDP